MSDDGKHNSPKISIYESIEEGRQGNPLSNTRGGDNTPSSFRLSPDSQSGDGGGSQVFNYADYLKTDSSFDEWGYTEGPKDFYDGSMLGQDSDHGGEYVRCAAGSATEAAGGCWTHLTKTTVEVRDPKTKFERANRVRLADRTTMCEDCYAWSVHNGECATCSSKGLDWEGDNFTCKACEDVESFQPDPDQYPVSHDELYAD